MIIRTANAADAESITEIHIASIKAAYSSFFPAEELARIDARDRADRWRDVFADGRSITLIAEADGRAAGFTSFGACRDDDLPQDSVGEVMAEYVHPEAWGRGFGRRLMQEALDRLMADDFRSVVVWTLDANRRAIGFYERFDFVCDCCRRGTMFGTQTTIIRLRRRAAPETV